MKTIACVDPDRESPNLFLSAAESTELSLDELSKLYLLALLLVPNKGIAESCFSDAMEDYLRSSGMNVAEWARTEGRTAVVQHAIQWTRPAPKVCSSWSRSGMPRPLIASEHEPFAAITSLSAFERFVYVLCMLEGYSEPDCAALLNCDPTEVRAGRDLADRFAATPDSDSTLPPCSDWIHSYIAPIHERCGIC